MVPTRWRTGGPITVANDTWLARRTAGLNLRNLVGRGLTRTTGIWTLMPQTT